MEGHGNGQHIHGQRLRSRRTANTRNTTVRSTVITTRSFMTDEGRLLATSSESESFTRTIKWKEGTTRMEFILVPGAKGVGNVTYTIRDAPVCEICLFTDPITPRKKRKRSPSSQKTRDDTCLRMKLGLFLYSLSKKSPEVFTKHVPVDVRKKLEEHTNPSGKNAKASTIGYWKQILGTWALKMMKKGKFPTELDDGFDESISDIEDADTRKRVDLAWNRAISSSKRKPVSIAGALSVNIEDSDSSSG